MKNNKDIKTEILIQSRVIANLEQQKVSVCNMIKDSKNRTKLYKIINQEIIERLESLNENLSFLESI